MRTAACASAFSTAAIAASASEVNETFSPRAMASGPIERSRSKNATSSAETSSPFQASERPAGQGRGAGFSRRVRSVGGAGGAWSTNAGRMRECVCSASYAARAFVKGIASK